LSVGLGHPASFAEVLSLQIIGKKLQKVKGIFNGNKIIMPQDSQ
jgi:hypothetical protein